MGMCRISQKRQRYCVGTCLWHVSNALIICRLQRNMPKACPYAMTPIVADINHRICQCKRDWGIFLFALSDNLISEIWFFAEGERFLSFWRCHHPLTRSVTLPKGCFFMFLFQPPQYLCAEPYFRTGGIL